MISTENHWREYQPSRKQPWDLKLAAHLYRRAGFGATYEQLLSAVDSGPQAAVNQLFKDSTSGTEDQFQILKKQIRSGGSLERLPTYWLYRMVKSPAQLLEKTTLFWHGHFATSAEKVDEVSLMLDQNDLLRSHALKKFEPMVQGISKDPAMLTYLDSKTNRKTRPNENFARELMELFCLGLGNYSEDDIKQVARTFTGWEVRNDRFKFNKYQHDYGVKKFLGSSGEFNGEQAVEIVLNHKSSTEFIAKKLINYFVTDLPVSDSVVAGLSGYLRESGFDIGQGIKRILKSQLFFDSVGHKIKSPVELGAGLLRSMEASSNFVRLAAGLKDLGQLPFYPPNVKGWPGGRTWINSATLLARINLVSQLLRDENTKMKDGGFDGLLDRYQVTTGEETLRFFESLLLAKPIPVQARKNILETIENGKGSRNDRMIASLVAIASLPEFQLA